MALANSSTARPVGSIQAALTDDQHAPTLPPGEYRDPAKIWILFYRHGVNPSCYKGFYFDGDMRGAIARIQKHCTLMGYKYIYIRPFMVDIDKEEADRAAAQAAAAG